MNFYYIEIPMSTGDEEEEEHDLTNNETVIPIELIKVN